MFDFGRPKPSLIHTETPIACFGCGEEVVGLIVKVDWDTYLCYACMPSAKLPPICCSIDQEKKRLAAEEIKKKAQEEYEARFCCSDWKNFTEVIMPEYGSIMIGDDGSMTGYYYYDDYINSSEELPDIAFKFCPYCQKPFKPVQTV